MKMATTETLPAASSMLSRGPVDMVDTAQSRPHGRVGSANNNYNYSSSSSRSNSRTGLYSRSNLRQHERHQQQQYRYTNGNDEVVEDDVVVQPMLERNVKTHTGTKKYFSIVTRWDFFVFLINFVGQKSFLSGHWYPCFWTSDDVSSGFQSQNGGPFLYLVEAHSLTFISDTTPSNLLVASMAAELFFSACLTVWDQADALSNELCRVG